MTTTHYQQGQLTIHKDPYVIQWQIDQQGVVCIQSTATDFQQTHVMFELEKLIHFYKIKGNILPPPPFFFLATPAAPSKQL